MTDITDEAVALYALAHSVNPEDVEYDDIWLANLAARLAEHDREVAAKARSEQANFTLDEWDEWSSTLASNLGDRWDGDEGQEDIVERFVSHYGQLDSLIDGVDYQADDVDGIVQIEYDRSTQKWRIVGTKPAGVDPEAARG